MGFFSALEAGANTLALYLMPRTHHQLSTFTHTFFPPSFLALAVSLNYTILVLVQAVLTYVSHNPPMRTQNDLVKGFVLVVGSAVTEWPLTMVLIKIWAWFCVILLGAWGE